MRDGNRDERAKYGKNQRRRADRSVESRDARAIRATSLRTTAIENFELRAVGEADATVYKGVHVDEVVCFAPLNRT